MSQLFCSFALLLFCSFAVLLFCSFALLLFFWRRSCESYPPPAWRPDDDDSPDFGTRDVYDDDAATPYTPQLFDLGADPREMHDLSNNSGYVSVIKQMRALQAKYQASAVPSLYDMYPDDYRADPAFHGGVWDSWGCEAP